ncbi:MAG: exopolysaccharide biosynthesis protein [Verrucomicrobia bacterium]|nr:exopolysaccharide biosynthesis protein [Verrucomicrobiota bacterium]
MRLSEEFQRLSVECADKEMNARELVHFIGPRSRALISLIFSVPFLFFIPLPGLSTLFGFLIAVCGYSIAFNKGIWFPNWMLKKKISGKLLAQAFQKGKIILVKIERAFRPRGLFLSKHPVVERINGFLIFFCALILMLPLPPGTNFPPGLAIFLLSIGILEEDGLFVILGYLAFLGNLAFFIYLPMLGVEALHKH